MSERHVHRFEPTERVTRRWGGLIVTREHVLQCECGMSSAEFVDELSMWLKTADERVASWTDDLARARRQIHCGDETCTDDHG